MWRPRKRIKNTIKQVVNMGVNQLLWDRIRENKDLETILVGTWHPTLSAI